MLARIAIKLFLVAGQLHLADEPTFRQNLQVAVDRAETHARQFPLDPFVNVVGGQVRVVAFELIEDELPLPGDSQVGVAKMTLTVFHNSNDN